MLTSSLLVRATMISASAAPAASSTGGYAALPTTVCTSSRSCRSRNTSSLTSTTVTSLASSRERCRATVRPTWPAPRMRIFMRRPSRLSSFQAQGGAPPPQRILTRFEVGILHHEPLGALLLEIHLDASVRPAAFDIQHHTLAEFAVPYPGAEAHPGRRGLLRPEPDDGVRLLAPHAGGGHCTGDLHAWPDLGDDVLRNLLDEARRRGMSVHAVHAPLLGVSEIQMLHRPSHADVAEAALLLQCFEIRHAAVVGEEPFLHSAEEHDRELEALRHVQRHHLYAVIPVIGPSLTGLERSVRQERFERGQLDIRALGAEAAGRAHELRQVLEPGLAARHPAARLGTRRILAGFLPSVMLDEAALPEDVIDLLVQRQPGGFLRELLDESVEAAQRIRGPPALLRLRERNACAP